MFQTVQQLGGVVSDRPRDCSHLVAPRVSQFRLTSSLSPFLPPPQVARTVKFLSGVSVCHWILTPEWIEQCEKERRLVNEEGFTLRDPDAETLFMMDIPTSLSRARQAKFLEVSLTIIMLQEQNLLRKKNTPRRSKIFMGRNL